MKKNTTDSKKYLGKKVYVKIDRPLNSKHPKHGFLYELNYGFIPGTLSPDGEELDAYIIGVDNAVEDFNGTCIAIIHRENDNDDKLIIVSQEKLFISDEDIRRLTHFQEKFFKSEILRIP